MYTHKKSTVIPALIFMKISSAQQRYLQISDTKFYTNRTINVESADRNSLALLRKAWLDPEINSATRIRNVCNYCLNDTASYARRVEPSGKFTVVNANVYVNKKNIFEIIAFSSTLIANIYIYI
jgi:hypothetical protein